MTPSRNLLRKSAAALALGAIVATTAGSLMPTKAFAATPATPGTQIGFVAGQTPADSAGNTTLDKGHHVAPRSETPTEAAIAADLLARWNAERVAHGLTDAPLVRSENLSREEQAWLYQEELGGVDLTSLDSTKGDGSLPVHTTGAYQAEVVSTASVFNQGENASTGWATYTTGTYLNAFAVSGVHEAMLMREATVAGIAVSCKANGDMNVLISSGFRNVAEAIAVSNARAASGWIDPSPLASMLPEIGKGMSCTKTTPTPAPTPTPTPTPTPGTGGAGGTLDTSLPVARMIDTRTSGQRLSAGSVLTVPVASGLTSGVIQLTAVNAAGPGFLTAFPCGTSAPLASNVNFTGPAAVGSLATVQLDAAGNVCVTSNTAVDVIVDRMAGFKAAPADGATAGRFVAQTPERLMDTRSGAGAFAAGESRSFTPNVPAGTKAVALNLTATNSGGGFLSVFPTASGWTGNSNLNLAAGQTLANAVIVPLDANGSFSVRTQTANDVIIDVTGSFTGESAAKSKTGLFVPQAPTRVIDTRNGVGAIAVGGTLTVATNVPAGATGVIATVTAIGSTNGYLTVFPTGQSMPASSSINTTAGVPVPNMVASGVNAQGQVSVFAQTSADAIVDVAGYFTA